MPLPKRLLKVPEVPNTCSLQVRVYDGTRNPFPDETGVLYRIIDANQNQVYVGERRNSSVPFVLPFHDNFLDNYSVIAFSDGFKQAGFSPVKLSTLTPATIDLMLIPKDGHFNFSNASWQWVKANLPFVANGVTDAVGQARYQSLVEGSPEKLAALLNITTAMRQIFLPQGTPLDYLKQIIWDQSLAQDRFFAYCDPALVDQVRAAAAHGEFAAEINPGFFHPSATASWKQIQFGEANVQLTFHEGEKSTIDGLSCIVVEPDIDYYKDLGAHALLEVIPNALTGGLTSPEEVYVLRWIAGRRAGVPEFDPPYTIER